MTALGHASHRWCLRARELDPLQFSSSPAPRVLIAVAYSGCGRAETQKCAAINLEGAILGAAGKAHYLQSHCTPLLTPKVPREY